MTGLDSAQQVPIPICEMSLKYLWDTSLYSECPLVWTVTVSVVLSAWRSYSKIYLWWAVVVAQLVERSLITPVVQGSNLVMGKIYIEHCLLSTVLKKTTIKKRGREWHI